MESIRLSFSRRPMLTIALVALAFRLLFLVWGGTGWYVLPQDSLSKIYFYQGYGLCAGYGYVRESQWTKLQELAEKVDDGVRITPGTAGPIDPQKIIPEMLHPPGMAMLVAGIHGLTGRPAEVFVELGGMLLDTLAACLVYWIAATFVSARVGLTAGLVYALYPPLAYASTLEKSSDGLLSAFVIGCLACVLQATRLTGWKRVACWVAGGLVLGAGCYFRPDYLLMPVAIGSALWAYSRRFWPSLLGMLLVQGVAVALLFPWAYRNYQYCGRWIFTSTSVGATLVTGLGEYQNPWSIVALDEARRDEAAAQGMKSPWGPDADAYFRHVFWECVANHPQAYAVAVLKRLPMALAAPQTFGLQNPLKTQRFTAAREQGQDRFQVIASRPFYVLAAYWDWLLMALLGIASLLCTGLMLICERHRFALMLLLLSPHLYSIGAHSLTHMEPRFLLPSMFCFLLGLAYVLCRGWRNGPAVDPCAGHGNPD
jgi:4-amino-4-deoxy-L-arabinose transferase-like glycosyltransferase